MQPHFSSEMSVSTWEYMCICYWISNIFRFSAGLCIQSFVLGIILSWGRISLTEWHRQDYFFSSGLSPTSHFLDQHIFHDLGVDSCSTVICFAKKSEFKAGSSWEHNWKMYNDVTYCIKRKQSFFSHCVMSSLVSLVEPQHYLLAMG